MAENMKEVLNQAWGATYPVDGIHLERNWISVNGKINWKWVELDQIDEYRYHPISQATSFLGMPNRMHNLDQEQTWTNIFYNFIGWEEDVSPLKKAVNLLLMPFRIPLNLISMPFKWIVNIAKLVTEFLPLVARDSLELAAERAAKRAAERNEDSKLATALNFFAHVFNVMYVLLRPITSPIQNMRDLWNQDKHLWGSQNEALSAIFPVLSVFQTGITYTVLFPLVVYGLVVTVLPAIVTELPVIMSHMPAWLSTIMSPVLAGMAKAWPFVAKYSGVIGAGLGYGIPTVGNLLDHLSSKMAGWFREWGAKPKVQQVQLEKPDVIGELDDKHDKHDELENVDKPNPNDEPKPAPQVELNSDSAVKDEPKSDQPQVPGSVSVINEKLQQEEERAAKEKLEQEEKEKQRLIEQQREREEEFSKQREHEMEQKRAEEERAAKEAKEKLEQEEGARKQATDEIQRSVERELEEFEKRLQQTEKAAAENAAQQAVAIKPEEEKARKQATDEIQRERDHVAESLAKLVECGANFVKPNQPELASHPSAMFSPANPVKVAQQASSTAEQERELPDNQPAPSKQ